MDGRIGVASQLGKGSVFTVEMPISELEPAEAWPRLDADQAVLAIGGPSSRHAMDRYLSQAGLAASDWRGEPAPDRGW